MNTAADIIVPRKNVVFDLTKNVKQQIFFDKVFQAVLRKTVERYFFYGGALRGGKTSVCLVILIMLAKMFKGSRWHIMRDSFTTLQATTIPSMRKFCPESDRVRWYEDKSNFHLHFKESDSSIFMVSESAYQDPDMNWMDGLETNGIFLEQMEGLKEKAFEKAKERTGSWVLDPMPPGLILGTFNPSQTWVKNKIYMPYVKGNLDKLMYFQEALPSDNPFVTEDQWNAWRSLDPVNFARYVQGNWDAVEVKNRYMTQYNPDKHESTAAKYDPRKQVHVWIDFNIDPFAVNLVHIWQDKEGLHCHVFDEIDIMDGSIHKLVEILQQKIRVSLPNARFTGDRSGAARNISQRDNASNWKLIERMLGVRPQQIVLHANPKHSNSRQDCNYFLYNYSDFKINPETCSNTVRDMKIVQANNEGEIIKSNRDKTEQRADHLDCMRYGINDDPIQNWYRLHSKLVKPVS